MLRLCLRRGLPKWHVCIEDILSGYDEQGKEIGEKQDRWLGSDPIPAGNRFQGEGGEILMTTGFKGLYIKNLTNPINWGIT